MKNKVLWFTGLSGSGKTTLATIIWSKFIKNHIPIILLDGDEIRKGISSDLDFTNNNRSENVRRVAEIAKLLIQQGFVVCVALISPFRKDRKIAKKIIGKKNFIEIYCNASLSDCKEKDIKGLYQKAIKGKIKNFTGISSKYEVPIDPDIVLYTKIHSIEGCINQLWEYLNE